MKQNSCVLSASLLLILVGLLVIFTSSSILRFVIRTNIILSPGSYSFESWRTLSERLPVDFYFFNWTNPEEINSAGVKPKFEEVGPYRFMFNITRTNVTWNKNGTVSYKPQKFWYYDTENVKSNLKDNVTTINAPAVGAVYAARSRNYIIRKGVSLTLNSLYSSIHITKSVGELLFDGYPDALTKMASTLPIFSDPNIPKWDKFAWFYMRNGTTNFEGVYNMGTGVNSTFGKLYNWNYQPRTTFYEGDCGKIEGSTGDNYHPDTIKDTITMFLPDFCRSLVLQYVEKTEVDGITGYKYVMGDYALDNGTKYPQNRCYCSSGDCIPSGVFNLTSCSYGAPAFPSLPHFYSADPYYRENIEGLHPEKKRHEFYVIVEPNTGIPLQVRARFQVNFLLDSVPDITRYEHVPKIFFPIMWIDQQSRIPRKELPGIRLLLNIPYICISLGLVLVILGVILLMILFVKRRKMEYVQKEEDEDIPFKTEYRHEIVKKM